MSTQTCLAAAFAATLATAPAALTFAPGYGGSAYFTNSGSDAVISYDWGADGHLYYLSSAGYPDTKVQRWDGSVSTSIYADSGTFAGASVVAIGDWVYFNDSTTSNVQNLWKFGPLSGTSSATLASTTANYGLYGHAGELFLSGAVGFGTAHVYHSALDASGDLLSNPASDLGEAFGSPGPLAFDAAGNLFYAPGYGDLSVYQWSAAEVANAIAGTIALPTTGVEWFDYAAAFPTVGGATSMLVDDAGTLWLTLSDFTAPSSLVRVAADGSSYEVVATSTDRLGELRQHAGQLYVSNGNQVIAVVPEPSTALLSLLAGLPFMRRRRR